MVKSRPRAPAPVLKSIQLHNAYLVLETPDGMLVVDQHALHERILFEQFKDALARRHLEVQPLLVPEPVELTAEQRACTLEHRAELAELGLGVEDFGGDTVIITRYPALLARRSPADIFRGVVEHLSGKGRMPTHEQFLSEIMSLMACHAAVRSGDPFTAGGDCRPGIHETFRPGCPSLPAWPTNSIAIHTAGPRPAVPAYLKPVLSFAVKMACAEA